MAVMADQRVMVWLHQQAWLRPDERLSLVVEGDDPRIQPARDVTSGPARTISAKPLAISVLPAGLATWETCRVTAASAAGKRNPLSRALTGQIPPPAPQAALPTTPIRPQNPAAAIPQGRSRPGTLPLSGPQASSCPARLPLSAPQASSCPARLHLAAPQAPSCPARLHLADPQAPSCRGKVRHSGCRRQPFPPVLSGRRCSPTRRTRPRIISGASARALTHVRSQTNQNKPSALNEKVKHHALSPFAQ